MKEQSFVFISASHKTGFETRSFFIMRVLERGGRAQAETRVLLVYTGHCHTRCNVSQMTLLVLASLDVGHVGLLIA